MYHDEPWIVSPEPIEGSEAIDKLWKEIGLIRQSVSSSDDRYTLSSGSPLDESTSERINFYASTLSNCNVPCPFGPTLGPLTWYNVVVSDPFGKAVFLLVKGFRIKEIEQASKKRRKTNNPSYEDTLLEEDVELELEVSCSQPDGSLFEKFRLSDVEEILPSKKAIWLLIDRFFKYVYPFMPYLDEEMFLKEVEGMIGHRSYSEEKVRIYVEKKLTIAQVCLLLLVLRLGYLSLIRNTYDSHNNQEKEYLCKQVVPAEAADLAYICLTQFRLLGSSSLDVFRCCLYMCLYRQVSPEDGEGGKCGSFQAFGAMLVQSAYSSGLNRDPIKAGVEDGKIRNLWRKTWYGLVCLDKSQACATGCPNNIIPQSYDTLMPVFEGAQCSNVKDYAIEEEVISSMHRSIKLQEVVNDLRMLALNVHSPPLVTEIVKKLTEVEAFLHENYGSLSSMLTLSSSVHTENVTKVKKLLEYIEASQLIITLYEHLFLHYEREWAHERSFFFLKKALSFSEEISLNFEKILVNGDRYYGRGFDYIVSPNLFAVRHKTQFAHFAIYLRCAYAENSTVRTELLKFLFKRIQEYTYTLKGISDKYFYAWRMNKFHMIIVSLVKGDSLDQTIEKTKEFPFFDKLKYSIFTDNSHYLSEVMDLLQPKEPIQRRLEAFNDKEIDSYWLGMLDTDSWLYNDKAMDDVFDMEQGFNEIFS